MAEDNLTRTNTKKGKVEGSTSPKRKRRQRAKSTGTCLVLMPFKEPFDTYFSMIFEPAVISAHLEPLRGDSLFRPSPIMADIWQMIQDAKVLLGELTGKNANVFYELGLAHALGKPVILVSETIEDVPFDLQPLRVILYDKSDPAWGTKLKADIVASLEETVGDVAKAVPPMFRKIVKSQAPEDSDLSVRLSELERRLAAMSAARPSFTTEGSSSEEDLVEWERVENYLKDFKRIRSRPFDSRSHAVAWTIDQLTRYPSGLVRKRLQQRLSELEAARVFDLAGSMHARPLLRSVRHPSVSPRRAGK